MSFALAVSVPAGFWGQWLLQTSHWECVETSSLCNRLLPWWQSWIPGGKKARMKLYSQDIKIMTLSELCNAPTWARRLSSEHSSSDITWSSSTRWVPFKAAEFCTSCTSSYSKGPPTQITQQCFRSATCHLGHRGERRFNWTLITIFWQFTSRSASFQWRFTFFEVLVSGRCDVLLVWNGNILHPAVCPGGNPGRTDNAFSYEQPKLWL